MSHVPPQGARAAARRGLELRREYGRGGTAVGVARARDIANGKALSDDTIGRMVSFFARHEGNRGSGSESPPSNGYIAWLLWGGDPGRTWANAVWRRIKREREKKMFSLRSFMFASAVGHVNITLNACGDMRKKKKKTSKGSAGGDGALGDLSMEPNEDATDESKNKNKRRRDAIQYSAEGNDGHMMGDKDKRKKEEKGTSGDMREKEREKKRDNKKNKRRMGLVIT